MCSVGVRNEGHFARIRLHVRAREVSEMTDILNMAITFTFFVEMLSNSLHKYILIVLMI